MILRFNRNFLFRSGFLDPAYQGCVVGHGVSSGGAGRGIQWVGSAVPYIALGYTQ